MQHHFIVYFDTEIDEWVLESDTSSFLNNGTIWNNSTDWTHAIDDDVNYAKDEELYGTLNAVLNKLNERK
jgi:hypothetical protein